MKGKGTSLSGLVGLGLGFLGARLRLGACAE